MSTPRDPVVSPETAQPLQEPARDLAIIGAGWSGLLMLKYARAQGLDYIERYAARFNLKHRALFTPSTQYPWRRAPVDQRVHTPLRRSA